LILCGCGAAGLAATVTLAASLTLPALGPAAIRPIRIVTTSGAVTNARHLIDGTGAPTRLTWLPGGPRPSITVDYGVDVEGTPIADVAAATDNPTLHLAYTEDRRFADVFGDNGGFGPFMANGVAARRSDDLAATGPGRLATPLPQGAARYEVITLASPGTLDLADAFIRSNAFTPVAPQGEFQCSDALLTKIWHAGAFTLQLDMLPAHAQPTNSAPVIVDGAKRDRAVWSGDLQIEIPTALAAFGSEAVPFARDSQLELLAGQSAGGALPGVLNLGGPGLIYSVSYGLRAIVAAGNYVESTADLDFAREGRPRIEKALGYYATLTDADGLVVTRASHSRQDGAVNGLDWDPYDGAVTGTGTAINAVYSRALTAAATIEDALGAPDQAARYSATAAGVNQAVNRLLFDPSRGLYALNAEDHTTIAEDANAEAILAGIPAAARAATVLAALRHHLWTPVGAAPFADAPARSPVLSPYVNGEEVAARFASGDDAGALDLIRRLWGPMVQPGQSYTGALWEKVAPGGGTLAFTGGDALNNNSLAHGWSTGPTWELSRYVLGVAAASPGYATWRIDPHTADLRWARGRLPTPHGPIVVAWTRTAAGLTLHLTAPYDTSGTVALVPGATAALDGAQVPPTTTEIPVTGGTHALVFTIRATRR
jgi:alpha-L-rhamnosidase